MMEKQDTLRETQSEFISPRVHVEKMQITGFLINGMREGDCMSFYYLQVLWLESKNLCNVLSRHFAFSFRGYHAFKSMMAISSSFAKIIVFLITICFSFDITDEHDDHVSDIDQDVSDFICSELVCCLSHCMSQYKSIGVFQFIAVVLALSPTSW